MQPQYAYSPDNLPIMRMPPELMAGGGLTAATQQIQSMGRGGDTTLVHMNPEEVRGLDAIARSQGTSLSVNPHTGLPEAFKLKNFLKAAAPALIGAALAPMTAGTSLAFLGTPMGAGLAVGGIEALRTKSLARGLSAGLGAAGGAGLGGALSTAGQSASSAAATAAIPENAIKAGVTGPMAPTVSGLEAMKLGAQGLTNEAGRAAFMTGAGGMSGLASKIGMAAAPALAIPGGDYKPTESQAAIRPFNFDYGQQDVTYRTGKPGESTAEQRYFTPTFTSLGVFKPGTEPAYTPVPRTTMPVFVAGGQIPDPTDEMTQDGGYAPGGKVRKVIKRGEDPYEFADLRAKDALHAAALENFNIGGLTALAKGGRPRYLQGAGDGMSDSIKARIGGVQEARLADGEFVIPADVVSHLGNGSSNAGAKRLYAMMDRIRSARTGKSKQAPQVKPEKYMPA